MKFIKNYSILLIALVFSVNFLIAQETENEFRSYNRAGDGKCIWDYLI